MVAKAFTVDLNKPLVFQVGHLGDAYEEWVNQPIISNKGPRFFKSDFLELFTRTVWWVIPPIWLPVVAYFVSMSVKAGHSGYELASLVTLGLLIWSLLEYTVHRYLLHTRTESYWANTAHYLFHGCHHKHPMDSLRLVFPPAVPAIVSIPAYNLLRLISTPTATPALFGGVLLGYVIYECMHYYLHHGKPSSGMTQNLKKYHLTHHYRIQSKGFGITSSLGDFVFGTRPELLVAGKKK